MEENTALAPSPQSLPSEVVEKVVIGGDLAGLNAAQRAEYYGAVCRSLGLNPLTKPFEYLDPQRQAQALCPAGLCRSIAPAAWHQHLYRQQRAHE